MRDKAQRRACTRKLGHGKLKHLHDKMYQCERCGEYIVRG